MCFLYCVFVLWLFNALNRKSKNVFKVRIALLIRIIHFAVSCRRSFQIGVTHKLMNDVERNVACVLVASCAENVSHGSFALKFS